MARSKQIEQKKQGPWKLTMYNSVMNEGGHDEYDDRYLDFSHNETGLNFKKEMAFIKGQGSCADRAPMKLIDVWNLLLKYTPMPSGFVYKKWVIMKGEDYFEYSLFDSVGSERELRYNNIIGDYTGKKMDFASFLNLLDRQEEIFDSQKQLELEARKSSTLNLEEMRIKIANKG